MPSRAAASALGDRLVVGATRAWLTVLLRSSETASIALTFDRSEAWGVSALSNAIFFGLQRQHGCKNSLPAPCETRLVAIVLNLRLDMQLFSILPFATGPQRAIRHFLGAKKINFWMSRY